MLRAKLLNRSGWKMKKRIRQRASATYQAMVIIAALLTFPAIGNAQAGTNSKLATSKNATRALSIAGKPRKDRAGEAAISSTKTNQQSQHRVSVAPQGGELGKNTGAYFKAGETLTCSQLGTRSILRK